MILNILSQNNSKKNTFQMFFSLSNIIKIKIQIVTNEKIIYSKYLHLSRLNDVFFLFSYLSSTNLIYFLYQISKSEKKRKYLYG